MNSANENLRAIRNKKALITKKYNEARLRLETKYTEDLNILNKEEHDLLQQFNDVPIEQIYNTKPKKYRKKPLIVEAYQTDKEMEIETPEGTMKANVGDYIITGIAGELYPCKPHIFKETYEEVKE
jgi:hypothetical protein